MIINLVWRMICKRCIYSKLSFHQERTFKVECEASLGELIYVTLSSEAILGVDNQWFCDKILVRTPEDDEILFPCYRWLGCEENLVLRTAKGRHSHLRKARIHMYPCSLLESSEVMCLKCTAHTQHDCIIHTF